jgi:RNA polymerase sigma-70 factor, ECF subfamily
MQVLEASPEIRNQPTALDAESAEWLRALESQPGLDRDRAVARLHDLLLRGARFEIGRRRGGAGRPEHDDLAHQAADDALAAILTKLAAYRGASRFTTWAYKFVLLEVGVKLRRRAWEGREVPLESDSVELRLRGRTPQGDAEAGELLRAVSDGIRSALSPHQREVLVAITLNDVPIDVLAERLGTTRGALYKSLHDARQKLRACLADGGFALDWLEEETR